MARPTSGFVQYVAPSSVAVGHYKTRVRFKKARPWAHLPPHLGEDAARALASQLARTAREGYAVEWSFTKRCFRALVECETGEILEPDLVGIVDLDAALVKAASLAVDAKVLGFKKMPAPTVPANARIRLDKHMEQWAETKRARGQTAVKAIESHVRIHIAPILGAERDPRDIREGDLEAFVHYLDKLVDAGELKWKSATNIWGSVTKYFDDISRGKNLDLRLRTDNPTRNVRGPDRGVETEKVHLYPSEFLALACHELIPLARRRAYTVAIYCYLRPGELETLRWEDIDLEREIVHIRRGMDRDRDVEKAPKAGRARLPFNIEPALLPLLAAMKAEGGTGRLFPEMGEAELHMARLLRADLLLAGVDRHELHHMSEPHEAPREWMTAHDCRTTGITWMAVRGDDPLVIMARAGHAQFSQTEAYTNRAALIRRGYGEVFPALPAALISGGPNVVQSRVPA